VARVVEPVRSCRCHDAILPPGGLATPCLQPVLRLRDRAQPHEPLVAGEPSWPLPSVAEVPAEHPPEERVAAPERGAPALAVAAPERRASLRNCRRSPSPPGLPPSLGEHAPATRRRSVPTSSGRGGGRPARCTGARAAVPAPPQTSTSPNRRCPA